MSHLLPLLSDSKWSWQLGTGLGTAGFSPFPPSPPEVSGLSLVLSGCPGWDHCSC